MHKSRLNILKISPSSLPTYLPAHLIKLLDGIIDSDVLLNEINFNVRIRPSRNHVFIKFSHCKCNYELCNLFKIHFKSLNDAYNLIPSAHPACFTKAVLLNIRLLPTSYSINVSLAFGRMFAQK